jgi:hypothetical protein
MANIGGNRGISGGAGSGDVLIDVFVGQIYNYNNFQTIKKAPSGAVACIIPNQERRSKTSGRAAKGESPRKGVIA